MGFLEAQKHYFDSFGLKAHQKALKLRQLHIFYIKYLQINKEQSFYFLSSNS